MSRSTKLRVNGQDMVLDGGEGGLLLWALRGQGLTGAKYGCGAGLCGACTVLLDGQAVRACVTPLADAEGKSVTTVEGLAGADGRLDPLQQAFVDHGAFQCAYCTPGMLMTAHALLRENPRPTREQIVARLDHNLCRCGAHRRIVDAVSAASARMGERP